MPYMFYLDNILLPVTPSELELAVKNQNKTVTLINDGEVNILKSAGLTEISFDCMIPQVEYPFAVYKSGFKNAKHYLDKLETLKNSKTPFQFIVTRATPNNELLFDTNLKVSLEEYTIKESADNGLDLIVSVNLKQYRSYATKTIKITINQNKPKPKPVPKSRPVSKNKPAPPKGRTVTVSPWGRPPHDCLWNMAQKYYGNGAQWKKIWKANPSIKNPDLIYDGQKVFIPA